MNYIAHPVKNNFDDDSIDNIKTKILNMINENDIKLNIIDVDIQKIIGGYVKYEGRFVAYRDPESNTRVNDPLSVMPNIVNVEHKLNIERYYPC